MKKDVDRWTALLACIAAFVALLITGDWIAALAFLIGLAIGVAGNDAIRDWIEELKR